MTINKSEAIAVFNGRKEFEIIYINAPVQEDYDKMKFFTPHWQNQEKFMHMRDGFSATTDNQKG